MWSRSLASLCLVYYDIVTSLSINAVRSAAKIFRDFDADGSGGLSLDEFVQLVEQLMPDKLGMDCFKILNDGQTRAWLQKSNPNGIAATPPYMQPPRQCFFTGW